MIVIADARSAPAPDPYELAALDGAGCLAFLLAAPTRESCSVADLCRRARPGSIDERTLRTLGLALTPAAGSPFVAIAISHPALSRIFSASLWIGDWSTPLMTLAGAARLPPMLFGRCYSAAILLPRSLLPERAR